ncbi:MAG: sulfurtransferase [Planctomycetaceae bacterium]|nr:sulfurtransferase [Planctomycetaceae bacterium]MCP4478126.1 sulfurtransferase [Planctomycetaceae bacterium]MCP4776951.1 sulfurtransferase [Planctomycetaceae bacterium]
MNNEFINISAYKFVDLDNLAQRKDELLPLCKSLKLKGTILLSLEGINLFVAGDRKAIDEFVDFLEQRPEYSDLPIKESISDHQPFSRMLVRLKKEIISMGVEKIRPVAKTSPKLPAQTLKNWLDEGKDVTLLDVRNDYEIEVGTFSNAVPIGIDHFRKFPEATRELSDDLKNKPLVMFCTGGIRCEKAGPFMEEEGFSEIYQLDGGILRYFEDCGGDHYDGECFVFDKRVAVDSKLNESDYEQCYACQAVLTLDDQDSKLYQPPHSCPSCFRTDEQRLAELLEERNNLIALKTTPLPGSLAYDNIRPMNVPLRFDKHKTIDFLCGMHANLKPEYWISECEQNRITYKHEPISAETVVRSGWRIEHHLPQTTEPAVNNQIKVLYEDDVIIAVDKPAPLPMHPCGRFNRNTLDYIINQVYVDEQIRILHRLDANTTGVVIMAKKKSAAQFIHPQFVNHQVNKTYLARVQGHPSEEQFDCDESISSEASTVGSRKITEAGRSAKTSFNVLHRFEDQTSLVECKPKTGRTNQIRIHLSHLGFPIIGDPTYNSAGELTQALELGEPPMCLHAYRVELTHPITKEILKIQAGLPDWATL